MRAPILADRCSQEEATQLLVSAYHRGGCDGLFLSGVTYEGLRLPVRQVGRALADAPRPPFVVADGARALAHVPTAFGQEGNWTEEISPK